LQGVVVDGTVAKRCDQRHKGAAKHGRTLLFGRWASGRLAQVNAAAP
jgi:hypothetical protein